MSEKLSAETYSELKDEVNEVVANQGNNRNVHVEDDRRFTGTEGGQSSGTIVDYSRLTSGEASVYTEKKVLPKFKNEEVSSQIQAKAITEAGTYYTKVGDENYIFAKGRREPVTTVTRVENGGRVVRKIYNPRAAELVTRLAMKKINQAGFKEEQKIA